MILLLRSTNFVISSTDNGWLESTARSLLQRSPDFTDDNDGVIMDEVTTIVMGKVTAQRLLEGLREMLEDEDV